MLSMHEFVDLRMQQQLAHEIYRQQIMQRIPDPFPTMLAMPCLPQPHIIMPPRPTLPGVDAELENNELWQQFHKIGTEMIITKSGRRMFPSMRISLSGLEEEANYCVLLEMAPIGDCRFKFSGSQWVPAGGAEPQSPQRIYLHPDSPATGAHWQSQALLFNKVKLTNNTLDNNGHIVLASMHKYQPRLHIIRTTDLSQFPWSPQQAFEFPETEFVAVTAYQNDRITKLKIDNNPFAKGFRESGQSRCKRKLNSELDMGADSSTSSSSSMGNALHTSDDDRSSVSSFDSPQCKRMRAFEDDRCSSGSLSPRFADAALYAPALYNSFHNHHHHHQHHHQQQQQHQQQLTHPATLTMELAAAAAYFGQHTFSLGASPLTLPVPISAPAHLLQAAQPSTHIVSTISSNKHQTPSVPSASVSSSRTHVAAAAATPTPTPTSTPPTKRSNNFSISAILAY